MIESIRLYGLGLVVISPYAGLRVVYLPKPSQNLYRVLAWLGLGIGLGIGFIYLSQANIKIYSTWLGLAWV